MSTHALLPDWEPGYIRDLARATRLTYGSERLAAVASDEYRAIVPVPVRKKLGHEYPLCYQLCLMDLLDKLARDRTELPLEQLLVVLDQGNKVYGKVQARHELMRKYPLVL